MLDENGGEELARNPNLKLNMWSGAPNTLVM